MDRIEVKDGVVRPEASGESFAFTVGGNLLPLIRTLSVADLVDQMAGDGRRVAIERNGQLLPRSQHAATRFNAGDRFEIVFAAGGA